MHKRTIEVTEWVCLKKNIEVMVPETGIPTDYLETPALLGALANLPNYEEAGWEQIGSDGCTFKEITNQNMNGGQNDRA